MNVTKINHDLTLLRNRLWGTVLFVLKVALVSAVLTLSCELLLIVIFCVVTTLFPSPVLQEFMTHSLTSPVLVGWLFSIIFLAVLALALFFLFFMSVNKTEDSENA